jgi:hypothetical protein
VFAGQQINGHFSHGAAALNWAVTTDVIKSSAFDTRGLIRVGILFLPLGGLLKLLGNLATYNSIGPGVSQATAAERVTAPGFLIGGLVGNIGPTLLTPFWVIPLFVYLVTRVENGRRMLTTAVVFILLGSGLALAALGVVNYAIPALGHAYLAGDAGAMDIADSFFKWPRGAMLYPAVLGPIGTILLAIVLWRTQALPRVAAVLFAVSAVLISTPAALHAVHVAGGLLGLVAGVWMAFVMRRNVDRVSS